MRLLLDHCVDRRLARVMPAHAVKSAREMGWDELKNGNLLAAAATQFDAIITVDQNIKHEQDLRTLPIAVIVLVAKSNRMKDLESLVPDVERALQSLKSGAMLEISSQHVITIITPGK